jgi:ABC-type xylose transport system permease subunit
MSSSQQSRTRTRTFARVLGPFFVILLVIAAARASDMRTVLSDLGANAFMAWVGGGLELLSGLVIIALHQYWRSLAAVIVSLLGWMLTLRGVALMAFPQTVISDANSMIDRIGTGTLWRIVCIGVAVIGLYLTYIGWKRAPSRSTAQVE